MIVISNKKELRQFALKKRVSVVNSIINNIIVKKIFDLAEFNKAKNIALYFPIKNEVDITSILNKDNEKKFYLPSCRDDKLEFRLYKKNDSLKIGSYDIPESTGEKINPDKLDVIFIPALMANKRRYRLGYGKGYYDRFFSQNNVKAKKVIILPSCLISDDFIEDDFDIPADMILSEKEIIC